MTATVLTVANQKGGAGKTTLAMQLAGAFSLRNMRTLVVDTDPQGTASRWAAAGDEKFPATVIQLTSAGEKIHTRLGDFLEDYRWIVVDTPPAAESATAQSALLVSNFALVPVIPSPPDLWAAVAIKEAIASASVVNEELEAFLFINQLQANTLFGAEIKELLEAFDLPLLEGVFGHRQVFKQSAAFGRTVLGMGNAAATIELETLSDEVLRMDLEKRASESGRADET